MKRELVALGAGAMFSVGLAVSGMTRPEKVLGFLDAAGAWDPSLALVMGGALAVTLVVFAWATRRGRPVLDETFHLPEVTRVDARLVAGAVLFGAGWGLSGYCPGPAIASVVTGSSDVLVFLATMVLGFATFEWLSAMRPAKAAEVERAVGPSVT